MSRAAEWGLVAFLSVMLALIIESHTTNHQKRSVECSVEILPPDEIWND